MDPSTRRRAFAAVTIGILGVWSAHNAWLRPLEVARVDDGVLVPALLALRVAVWIVPILAFVHRFDPRGPGVALALTTRIAPVGALLGGVPAAAYLALVATLVGLPDASTLTGPALVALVAGVVLEEVLMRGFLYGELARWTGSPVAVGVSAATFAAMHLPGWLGEGRPVEEMIPSAIALFLLGLGLGIARAASGSLWPPIVLHVSNNLLGS